MTTSYEQRLQPTEILTILNSCSSINSYSVSKQKKQLSIIFQAFIHLNYYLLMKPESLTLNFRSPILSIFENPPDIKVLEYCTNCIITALKSEITTIVRPSDFPYDYILSKVKNQQLSEDTIITLLEIIFTNMNKQIDYIQKIHPTDIDYFFKYYNILSIPSQVNCMKCINTIISVLIFDRYNVFLPQILDILNTISTDKRIYQYALNSIILLLKFLLAKRMMRFDSIDPIQFCEKLCIFTSNFKDKENLPIFIKSITLCMSSFNFTRNTVINIFNLSSFFDNASSNQIFESMLNLIYFLVPIQNEHLIEMIHLEKYNFKDKNITPALILQIQNVFNSICNVYCSNLNFSKKCLQIISILVNSVEFNLVFSNRFIHMLCFQMNNKEFFVYILSIIRDGIKIKQNVEIIIHSGVLELITKTIEKNVFNLNYFSESIIIELNRFYRSKKKKIKNHDKITNIYDLVNSIDSNPFFSNEIFSSYYQNRITSQHHLYFNQFLTIFESIENLNSIEDSCQKVVDFFIKMMIEIPNPPVYEDVYYPNYDSFLQGSLTFNYSKIPFNSILAERIDTEVQYFKRDFHKFYHDYQGDLKSILDSSMFDEMNDYLMNILYHELKDCSRSKCSIENININDEDQFVLRLLPQIFYLDTNVRIDKKFNSINSTKIDYLSKPSKFNTFISKHNYSLGNEIIENILNLLSLINQKDKNRKINFICEPFQSIYIDQLKYFYLTMCLFSPVSKMMFNYPFLFNMSDRLFLFQLLIKEPLMAKDHYDKKYVPNFVPVPKKNYSILKFIINRQNIFKEGLLILEKFAKYVSFFEIKFRGEMGQGPGLTKEFFHIMSKEFCKKRHRIWRRDNENDNDSMKLYAHNKQGLFPYATANSRYMYDLGLFVAKAIQMEEVIDIPFNPCFFDMANGKEIDLKDVDETLSNSLNDPSTAEALIGFPFQVDVEGKSFDLVKNGENVLITKQNFHIYKDELTKFVCGKHVRKVVNYFVNGFSEVLDPNLLKMFSGNEMIDIINGQRELFSIDDFKKYIICGNGYTNESFHVQLLIQVVTEFDKTNQKLFLQFVTGSPFLPIGGLEALNPPITVVRKYSSNKKLRDEDYLPSSQTCINTFYLPPYQSKEIMRMKIIKVITECRESFDLI